MRRGAQVSSEMCKNTSMLLRIDKHKKAEHNKISQNLLFLRRLDLPWLFLNTLVAHKV